MKKFFALMIMVFAMAISASAVGTNTNKRLLAKSLKIEKVGNEVKVSKDGQAFTGIFWANDAKSIQYKAENGKVVRTIVFYPNQKICYKQDGNEFIYYCRDGQHVQRLAPKDVQYSKDVVKKLGI